MLRLASSHPPLWRTPSSLQLGTEDAVHVDRVTPWQEHLLNALEDGVPDDMLGPLARSEGATHAEAAEFVTRIAGALSPRFPTSPYGSRVAIELPADLSYAEESALVAGVTAAGWDIAHIAGWVPEDRDPDLPVLLVAHRMVDPRRSARLMASDTVHIPCELAGDAITVGPLVVPGTTPCLACVHAHRRDRDAEWPSLAAQLLGRPAIRTDLALVTEAALLAARLLAAEPSAASPSIRLTSLSVRRRWRAHRPHAQCSCQSLSETAIPVAVDARFAPTMTTTRSARRA